MTTATSTARAAEDFITDYVARHCDEHGEVRAADCIRAAEDAGFPRAAITKSRNRIAHRIGTRRTSRRDGDDVSGDQHWFPYFDPDLLADSTHVESDLAQRITAARPLLNAGQRERLINLLRRGDVE